MNVARYELLHRHWEQDDRLEDDVDDDDDDNDDFLPRRETMVKTTVTSDDDLRIAKRDKIWSTEHTGDKMFRSTKIIENASGISKLREKDNPTTSERRARIGPYIYLRRLIGKPRSEDPHRYRSPTPITITI